MANTTIKFDLSKKEAEKIGRLALSRGLSLNNFFKKISLQMLDTPQNKYSRDDFIKTVVGDFLATNLYTKGFLKDLESGLKKSSYVQ